MKMKDKLIAETARKHLGIETLTTRNSDELDFHSVAVWGVKDALETIWNERDAYIQRLQKKITRLEADALKR